jgi:hypothetical protein
LCSLVSGTEVALGLVIFTVSRLSKILEVVPRGHIGEVDSSRELLAVLYASIVSWHTMKIGEESPHCQGRFVR